jgi:hypothetical protein
MSRFSKHKTGSVIAVDRNFFPMMEVSRRNALTALATGRAHALDIRTWARLGLMDVVGKALQVIVFPKAKAVPEANLGLGRGNRAILRRDSHVCQYIGCNHKAGTVDHVIPRCQGGQSTWTNLVACCKGCNTRKGGRTPDQAGMKLKAPVRSPRFHLLEKFNALVARSA